MSNPFGKQVIGSGEGSRPQEAWRGQFDVNDDPVYEPINWDGGKYVAPNSGQYTLMVTGFTRPEVDTTFANSKGEYVEKLGVELEIVSERGKGFRFIWSYQTPKISFGDSKYSPSNLGRIYMAAVSDGVALPKGTEVSHVDMLGKPFDCYVKASDEKNDRGMPKYAKVTADTIEKSRAGSDAGPDPFSGALNAA